MALHHRPVISDMRGAYAYEDSSQRQHFHEMNSIKSYRSDTDKSYDSRTTHRYSDQSSCAYTNDSYNTQPTATSEYPADSSRRPQKPTVHNPGRVYRLDDQQSRYIGTIPRCSSPPSYSSERVIPAEEDDEDSAESTVDSDDDETYDMPEYDRPEYTAEHYEPTATPSRPSDFSQLFPSHRRLDIRHDDGPDGHMNLRVDTVVKDEYDDKFDMTLFHLRMHDLVSRDFSLRRYCRDSGREVCHSMRKEQKSSNARRPGIQRTLSNALSSMRPKLESRSSWGPTTSSLTRHDSGYSSMHSSDGEHRPASSGSDVLSKGEPSLPNSVKLEFSNYAQMDVNFSKDKKRYEFDYWRWKFAWKRISQKGSPEVSFQLINREASGKKALAYIKPIPLTDLEVEEERRKGRWIPKSMMWLADEGIVNASKDVADAIVAAGLMALVDDSLRSSFHSKDSKLLLIPVSRPNSDVDFVGPHRLIDEMFGRKDSKLDGQNSYASNETRSKASRAASRSGRTSSREC